MYLGQLNAAVASFTNVDTVSLHTSHPGDTGANELVLTGYTRKSITFSTPSAGYIFGLVEFLDVVGDIEYAGLWDGTTFISSKPLMATLPSPQRLRVLVEVTAEEKL